MKKIQITEQNQNLYETLYLIKSGKKTPSKKDGLITTSVTVFAVLALIIACLLFSLTFPESIIVNTIITGVTIVGSLSYPFFALKLNIHLKVKEFKKKYPHIETNISTNKLKQELEKYERLSEQKRKAKKSISYSNNIEKSKHITREERLAYLEKERDSLKQLNYEETSRGSLVKKI